MQQETVMAHGTLRAILACGIMCVLAAAKREGTHIHRRMAHSVP